MSAKILESGKVGSRGDGVEVDRESSYPRSSHGDERESDEFVEGQDIDDALCPNRVERPDPQPGARRLYQVGQGCDDCVSISIGK